MTYPSRSRVVASTKFIPPRLRDDLVSRPQLVDRLHRSDAPVAVVSGPPGSGKSVLMAQWHSIEPHTVWLSLDAGDNDPTVLWLSLIAGIDREIDGFADQHRRRSTAAGSVSFNDVASLVADNLAERDLSLCLFLDDAHLIENASCLASIHRLAQRLPRGVRLAIASRTSEPIPLARLRANRDLVEISGLSLMMSADESMRVLAGLGVDATANELATIVDRAEGWVAALQLAALAFQQDASGSSDLLKGSHRFVADYLIAEILDRLPIDDQRFLLETSILDQLSGELCDAVCGQDGSAMRLARLERDNAFVIPLDRDGEWYRYHHLFSEALLTILARRHPDRVPTLHRSAFEWLRSGGYVVDAIRHALAAGERRQAAQMVCAHWYELANTGRATTLRLLIDQFNPHEIEDFQPFAIAATWIYGVTGDADSAHRYLEAAGRGTYEGDPPDGSYSMMSSLALVRSVFGWDGVGSALADAQLAYSLEPPASKWRPLAAWLLADRQIWSGNWQVATPLLEEVLEAPGDHGVIRALAFAMLSLSHLERDDAGRAIDLANSAYRAVEQNETHDVVTAAKVHAVRSRTACSVGDRAQARNSLKAARKSVERVDRALPLGGIHARILNAEAARDLGEVEEVRHHVAKASAVAESISDTGVFSDQLSRLHAWTETEPAGGRSANLGEAKLSRRELEVIELLSTKLTNRQIADELFVSPNTIKTHLRRVYSKLGVSSRGDAVVAAKRLGLLEHPETPAL